MVVAFFRPSDARGADHFIILAPVAPRQVTVGDDGFGHKAGADIVRVDESHETVPVHLRDAVIGIPGKALEIREVDARPGLLMILGIVAVADAVVLVKIDIVDAAIIRGHGGDHAVGLGLLMVDVLTQAVPQLGDVVAEGLHALAVRVGGVHGPGFHGKRARQGFQIPRQLPEVALDDLHPAAVLAGQQNGDADAHGQKQGAGDQNGPLGLVDLVVVPVDAEVGRDHCGHPAVMGKDRAVGAVEDAPFVLIGAVVHGRRTPACKFERFRIRKGIAEGRR